MDDGGGGDWCADLCEGGGCVDQGEDAGLDALEDEEGGHLFGLGWGKCFLWLGGGAGRALRAARRARLRQGQVA